MAEDEAANSMMGKVGCFAEQLATWDKRIIRIIAVGGLAGDVLPPEEVIQLVCTFCPEPSSDSQGFFAVINLLLRDDFEGASAGLDIRQSIDLGFEMDDEVHLPNGVIFETPKNPQIIWPHYDEPEPTN